MYQNHLPITVHKRYICCLDMVGTCPTNNALLGRFAHQPQCKGCSKFSHRQAVQCTSLSTCKEQKEQDAWDTHPSQNFPAAMAGLTNCEMFHVPAKPNKVDQAVHGTHYAPLIMKAHPKAAAQACFNTRSSYTTGLLLSTKSETSRQRPFGQVRYVTTDSKQGRTCAPLWHIGEVGDDRSNATQHQGVLPSEVCAVSDDSCNHVGDRSFSSGCLDGPWQTNSTWSRCHGRGYGWGTDFYQVAVVCTLRQQKVS
jgi:hypothetical protein